MWGMETWDLTLFKMHPTKELPGTLPKTNIGPKNGGFPIGISFSRGLFSCAMLVSGRVSMQDFRG